MAFFGICTNKNVFYLLLPHKPYFLKIATLRTLSVNFAWCTNILCITMSSRTQNLQIFIFRHMGKKAIRAKNVKNEELT